MHDEVSYKCIITFEYLALPPSCMGYEPDFGLQAPKARILYLIKEISEWRTQFSLPGQPFMSPRKLTIAMSCMKAEMGGHT